MPETSISSDSYLRIILKNLLLTVLSVETHNPVPTKANLQMPLVKKKKKDKSSTMIPGSAGIEDALLF